jgi:uncharacterized protein (TIGR02117 family)
MKNGLVKAFKWMGFTIVGLFCLITIYGIITWLLFYFPVNRDAAQKGAKDLSIFILSNGVHTDIVVPVKNNIMDWRKIAPFENTDSKDTTFQYAAFGWGDKGFYLETPEWSDLKASTALKAMFHLGSTAIHVDFVRSLRSGDHCKEIRISKDQYRKLVDFLLKSFCLDKNGNSILITTHNDGYGADDAFYEAKGAYDIFHTCNSWANDALLACDQKACVWTPVDRGILYQYK